jgi:hypothetical protein
VVQGEGVVLGDGQLYKFGSMKPPLFSPPLTSDTAQDYMHRARMFRNAAIPMNDYVNGEQFWPKYALLTHAIELALKAFARHSVAAGKHRLQEPRQHDLSGWYNLAILYGLSDKPGVADSINALNELHFNHFTRYPQRRFAPLPDASVIADSTVDYLIDTFTPLINPR